MCGIAGINDDRVSVIQAINNRQKRRGPDQQGIYNDRSVTMGQTVLSIRGIWSTVPHTYPHKDPQVVVSFNGEIYNDKPLRKTLKQNGHHFKTSSDVEIIGAAYKEWGVDFTKKLNGQWGIGLYDNGNDQFVLSRDHFGQRPVYYYQHDQTFAFASDLKALHKSLGGSVPLTRSTHAAKLYFALGFIPAPDTIYSEIYKVKPRQTIVYDNTKNTVQKTTYYDLPSYTPSTKSKQHLIKKGRFLLRNAIDRRTTSNQEAFLVSGGIDSSAILAYSRLGPDNKKAYTTSFANNDYDESEYARTLCDQLGVDLTTISFAQKPLLELISSYVDLTGEPFFDYAGLPNSVLSKNVAQDYKYALTGDGGDEAFGGYDNHIGAGLFQVLVALPDPILTVLSTLPTPSSPDPYLNGSLRTLPALAQQALKDNSTLYADTMGSFRYTPPTYRQWSQENMRQALDRANGNVAEAARLYDLLFRTTADNYLARSDKTAMNNALETRAPFLDQNIQEFAQTIPTGLKVGYTGGKKLLKQMVKDDVPDAIINRSKQGFRPPVVQWVNKDKYTRYIKSNLPVLKTIDPDLFSFYRNRVIDQDHLLASTYKLRFLLFYLWQKQK